MSYARPGVFVEEQLSAANPNVDTASAIAVFVAAHGRGPVTPQRIDSWSDFTRRFGGFPSRTSMLPHTVFQFLNNGGRRAHVLRVVGANSAVADLTLDDTDGSDPQPTLKIEAANPGEWGNRLNVAVNHTVDDRFDLTVRFGGTSSQHIVETFEDLTMDPDDSRYVEKVINHSAASSTYIVVEDLFSSNFDSELGYASVLPDPVDDDELAGGANGDTPSASDLVEALDNLGEITQTHVLNFPGVSDETVINGGLAYCETTKKAFLVIDTAPGTSVEDATTYADTLSSSSYGAIYYPWVRVSDPASNSRGNTELVPPGGAVAGIMAATDASRGVWKAPAGLAARVSGAVALERSFSDDDLDTLNRGAVNAIRQIPGAGVVVMGARTLRRSTIDRFVPVRRTLIFLTNALKDATLYAAFEPNDRVLWSGLQAKLTQFLTEFWQGGGLRGSSPAEAFYVKADSSNNTPESIAAGRVNIEVGVALQSPAEFIVIRLSQWEGGTSANEDTPSV